MKKVKIYTPNLFSVFNTLYTSGAGIGVLFNFIQNAKLPGKREKAPNFVVPLMSGELPLSKQWRGQSADMS